MHRRRPGGSGRWGCRVPARACPLGDRRVDGAESKEWRCTRGRCRRWATRPIRLGWRITRRPPATPARYCASRRTPPGARRLSARTARARRSMRERFASPRAWRRTRRAELLERRAYECMLTDQTDEAVEALRGALALRDGARATSAAKAEGLQLLSNVLWCPGLVAEANQAAREAVTLVRGSRPRSRAGDGIRPRWRNCVTTPRTSTGLSHGARGRLTWRTRSVRHRSPFTR